MRLRQWISCALLMGFTLASPFAHAQLKSKSSKASKTTTAVKTKRGKTKVKYYKTTYIRFGEGLVDGVLYKPNGKVFQVRDRSHFNSLVKFRFSFNKELFKTAKNL